VANENTINLKTRNAAHLNANKHYTVNYSLSSKKRSTVRKESRYGSKQNFNKQF